MRRLLRVWGIVPIIALLVCFASAQQDRLAGRWEGKTKSLQGELPTTAIFKKEGESYTGTITGMRGDLQLKEIKVEGEKVVAKAEVETPQGVVLINYSLALQGETLKGTGSVDFNGNTFSFDLDLKRAAEGAASSSGATDQRSAQPQRTSVPQPQQKQSIDYFAGQWSFKYIGRESALWPAPREGVVNFVKRADGKSLEGLIDGKHDGGAYKESMVIIYDETSKTLSFTERLASGAVLSSKGDWSSPIAIRFTIDPVKVKSQTLQLRRIMNIVSAHSFTIAEELSEDGGPFVRLGSALFTRGGAK